MASERASDPTCTCPSGDGSLRWPCPKHPPAAAPAEMSPELTDTARAAIAWVLWHHQGASSPVGQPLRFALGMGADEPLPDWRIAEAKRYAAWAGATTAKFHEARAITPAAPGIDLVSDILTDLSNVAGSWVVEAAGASADAQNDCAMQMHEAIERWSNKLQLGDASPKGGSEALDAARYRHLRSRRGGDGPAAGVRCLDGPYFNREIYGEQLDKAVDTDMQAQAGDAEVPHG